MDAWRIRREDTGDVTETAAEAPGRDEVRRRDEERGAVGRSAQLFEDDAWRKPAAAGDALAEVLSIGDVFNMIRSTLSGTNIDRIHPTLLVKGLVNLEEAEWRRTGSRRNRWKTMGSLAGFVDGLKP